MTQYARPSSDITNTYWWESIGTSQSNLYAAIDETSRSDADYIYTAPNQTGNCTIQLSAIDDPAVSSDHVLSYTYTRGVSNKDLTLQVTLYSALTLIAQYTHANPSTDYTLAQQTLVSSDADAITDYTDLWMRFNVTVNGGAGQQGYVSWAEFAVPDASANVTINANNAGTVIWTGVSGSVTPGAVSITSSAAASFVWTSLSATITNVPPARTINGAAGTSVWTGLAGSIIPGAVNVSANAGTALWTGSAGSVTPGAISITASASTIIWTGTATNVTVGASTINASAGVVVWAGLAGSVTPGATSVTANVGGQVWSGASASVTPGAVSVSASSGALVWVGQSATVTSASGISINANAGTLVWNGNSATITAILVRAIVTLSDSAVHVVTISDWSP